MKKNLVIIAFSLLLTSCATTHPYSFENFNIDLKSVEKQGIFVTNGDITNKEYKTAGFVVSTCYPGYVIKYKAEKDVQKTKTDDVYSTAGMPAKGSKYIQCSYEEMFSALVDQTKALNANAIINLRVFQISRPSTDQKSLQWGVQIEGLAVSILTD